MFRCSECRKTLVVTEGVKDDTWKVVAGVSAMILCGPIGTTVGALAAAPTVWRRLKHKEIRVTCPHCGADLYLSPEEHKVLKHYVKRAQELERRKNRPGVYEDYNE